jgi:hypothetical protein
MAVGAGNAIIARSIDPDRLYGLSATLATAYSALALIATPVAVSHFCAFSKFWHGFSLNSVTPEPVGPP